MEISCREVWREISDYLDDEVALDLRPRMEEHFRVCRHCRAVLDGTRNTLLLVADEQSFELPPRTSQKLYRRIKKHLS
jgi:predicted anti-sigma-YlaC factor YlaD